MFAILTIDAFDGRQCPSGLSVIRTISLFVSFMKKKVSLKKKKKKKQIIGVIFYYRNNVKRIISVELVIGSIKFPIRV